MKKLLMLLLALLLCTPVACAQTQTYESDFSVDEDGWYARGAVLQRVKDGLFVYGRTATWNSPGRAFDLVPGAVYQISVEVKQARIDSANFILSCEHARGGETSYENIAFGTAGRNEWVTLAAQWTAGDFDTYVLYIEGAEADTPFTIRNFKLTGAAPRAAGDEETEQEDRRKPPALHPALRRRPRLPGLERPPVHLPHQRRH